MAPSRTPGSLLPDFHGLPVVFDEEIRKLLLERFDFRFVPKDDVRLARMSEEVILMVRLRRPSFSWGWFLVTLVGASAMHLAANVVNDYYDESSGADAAARTDPSGMATVHDWIAGLPP